MHTYRCSHAGRRVGVRLGNSRPPKTKSPLRRRRRTGYRTSTGTGLPRRPAPMDSSSCPRNEVRHALHVCFLDSPTLFYAFSVVASPLAGLAGWLKGRAAARAGIVGSVCSSYLFLCFFDTHCDTPLGDGVSCLFFVIAFYFQCFALPQRTCACLPRHPLTQHRFSFLFFF